MATFRSFQDMLNEYLPNKLLFEELIKRDYILSHVNMRNDWKGGNLVVPFKGAGASSVKFGGLTDESDIAESLYVRGNIPDYVESWASLQFHHRDLMDHSGRIPESTFLRVLPDEVERMMAYYKEAISVQLGSGPHFATLAADGDFGAVIGALVVDKIDRFCIGQKLFLDDDDSALSAALYVISIDVNASQLIVSATRGGAATTVAAYTTAQNARCYHDGLSSAGGGYNSLRSALLSAANGGTSAIHGVNKLLYPHLQAINVPGNSITSSNILDKLFDAYTDVRTKAKGTADTYLMSFKHMGSIMKLVEAQKGPYVVTKNASASLYGWTELEITSVKGSLKLVGIQEMDDDIIPIVDWKTMTFNTNGGFKKRMAPDGREYFEVRSSAANGGYKYIVDLCLFGEMSYELIGQNAIIHTIDY